jgi:hypothetical protein
VKHNVHPSTEFGDANGITDHHGRGNRSGAVLDKADPSRLPFLQ